ncbi:PilZ domain-containing protein [Acidobacteria bacterium AH-259-D05]|nr:PilZ domain-containing protein [Acidobacteria bacterium AH-259-D05]
MSETIIGTLGDYLKSGLAVSIQRESQEQLAAIVDTISSDSVWLELPRPTSQSPFKKGEELGVQYWDEGAIIYSWEAEVIDIAGTENQRLSVSMSREVSVQRRKSYRALARIPFSFTVIDATEAALAGETVTNWETENISVGGLLFKSELPLKVGDRLALTIHLDSPRPVNAAGWVVRSQPVEQEGQSSHFVALRFLPLEKEEKNHLLEFLRSFYG